MSEYAVVLKERYDRMEWYECVPRRSKRKNGQKRPPFPFQPRSWPPRTLLETAICSHQPLQPQPKPPSQKPGASCMMTIYHGDSSPMSSCNDNTLAESAKQSLNNFLCQSTARPPKAPQVIADHLYPFRSNARPLSNNAKI